MKPARMGRHTNGFGGGRFYEASLSGKDRAWLGNHTSARS